MPYYLFALIWSILILLALVGWGGLLGRLLFPKQRIDWGLKAAWGVAFSVAVGGVLNVLWSISAVVVLAYLALGVLFWFLDALRLRPALVIHRRFAKTHLLIGAAIAVLAAIQYTGTISVSRYDFPSSPAGAVRFNQADDFQAYFVFPEKMLELGAMGRDPFSSRRLESSLGGQSFLDTFILCILPVQYLHIIDPGLGLLLILGLVWGAANERRISLSWSLVICFVIVWIDPPTVNVASLYTGTALFIGLLRTLSWKALDIAPLFAKAVILALLAAALCSLKSNFIPACITALVCSFACYLISQRFRKSALIELLVTASLTLVFLLPWMISMYQSSGTFLYPLLGKGYHQSAYNNSLCPYCWLTPLVAVQLLVKHSTDVSFITFAALAFLYLMLARRRDTLAPKPFVSGREATLSILVAATIGHIAMTLATAESNSRYSFSFLFAASIVLWLELATPREQAQNASFAPIVQVAPAMLAAFLVGASWDTSRIFYAECLRSAEAGIKNESLLSVQDQKTYQALQDSIPPGQLLLAKLDKPFLLDFKRNPVWVVDWAAASPPPGLPFSKGCEAMANYLRSQSIRYAAYSYGGEAMRRKLPTYFPWMKIQLLYSYDFEDNMEGLAKTRKRIFDDGNSFVLDLSE